MLKSIREIVQTLEKQGQWCLIQYLDCPYSQKQIDRLKPFSPAHIRQAPTSVSNTNTTHGNLLF